MASPAEAVVYDCGRLAPASISGGLSLSTQCITSVGFTVGLATSLSLALLVRIIVELDVFCVLRLIPFKEIRDLLLGLHEDLGESFGDVFVAVIVEGGSHADVADTSGTPNAMHVLVDASIFSAGEVVVDDMHDVLDVEATSRDTSGNEDGSFASLESTSNEEVSGQFENKR